MENLNDLGEYLNTEIVCTLAGLGYSEGSDYYKSPDCLGKLNKSIEKCYKLQALGPRATLERIVRFFRGRRVEGGQFFFSVLFFSWLKALYECSFPSLLDISLFSFGVQFFLFNKSFAEVFCFGICLTSPPLPSKMK